MHTNDLANYNPNTTDRIQQPESSAAIHCSSPQARNEIKTMGLSKTPASSTGYGEVPADTTRWTSATCLTDGHQKQNVDMPSIFQGSLVPVLAQGIASWLYLLPIKKYQNTVNIKVPVSHQFHLLKGMEQLRPCSSNFVLFQIGQFDLV